MTTEEIIDQIEKNNRRILMSARMVVRILLTGAAMVLLISSK